MNSEIAPERHVKILQAASEGDAGAEAGDAAAASAAHDDWHK